MTEKTQTKTKFVLNLTLLYIMTWTFNKLYTFLGYAGIFHWTIIIRLCNYQTKIKLLYLYSHLPTFYRLKEKEL